MLPAQAIHQGLPPPPQPLLFSLSFFPILLEPFHFAPSCGCLQAWFFSLAFLVPQISRAGGPVLLLGGYDPNWWMIIMTAFVSVFLDRSLLFSPLTALASLLFLCKCGKWSNVFRRYFLFPVCREKSCLLFPSTISDHVFPALSVFPFLPHLTFASSKPTKERQ